MGWGGGLKREGEGENKIERGERGWGSINGGGGGGETLRPRKLST